MEQIKEKRTNNLAVATDSVEWNISLLMAKWGQLHQPESKQPSQCVGERKRNEQV